MKNWKSLLWISVIALMVFTVINYMIIPYPPLNTNSQFKIFLYHLVSGSGVFIIGFTGLFIIFFVINAISKGKENALAMAKTALILSIGLNMLMVFGVLYGKYR